MLGEGGYTLTVQSGDSARYFRLVGGRHVFDSLETSGGWQTTAVVPGGTLRPVWYPLPAVGQARIYGTGPRNEDFVVRFGWGDGDPWRDCVGTLDIVDWGNAMEDATLGILLRVKPENPLWFADDGLPDQRYAGLLTFKKADNPAESALAITGPGGTVLREVRFPAVSPEKQYRLRFWALGDQLTLELFDRANLNSPIQPLVTVTDGRIPEGLEGVYGTKSAGGTYEVWIDQIVFNGAAAY
jgi:hypothetical protein